MLESVPTSRSARRWIGVAVVVLVVALQTMSEILADRAKERVLLRLGMTAVQMVILMLTLSACSEWATKRRWGSVKQLVLGVLLAGALGAIFGAVMWKV